MELTDCPDCHELAADLRETREKLEETDNEVGRLLIEKIELQGELEKIKDALKIRVDHGSWFYKNCKIQRRKGAKICQVCPFRVLIEATE